MGTTRQTHGTPGRDMWTQSTGKGIAAASGHESAPIRGFGRATAGGGYLPRSAKHEGSRPEDSALAAIPLNSHADLQWAMVGMTSGDFLVAGQTDRNKIKTFKKTKTKRGEWAPLTVTVWSSVTVHTRGGYRNTQTRI